MPWGVPEAVIDQVAADLNLSAVTNAYVTNGGKLVLISGGEAYTVPLPAEGKTNTLPRGPKQPASLDQADATPAPEPSTGGSGPPLDLEPPQKGLDDFTAIDSVGPVTAQKLHDAGLYTYDDLRGWPDIVGKLTSPRQTQQIFDWLAQHLL